MPHQTSPFSPYHPPQKGEAAPFQNYINAVTRQGGIALWAHPEARAYKSPRKLGPITTQTKPYSHLLRKTDGYTAFAGLYADAVTITDPGALWDELTKDYLTGTRGTPVFTYSEADWNGLSSLRIDRYQNVFLLRPNTPLNENNLVNAFREGNFYAMDTKRSNGFEVDFYYQEVLSQQKIFAGHAPTGVGKFVLNIRERKNGRVPLKIQIIRNGTIWRSLSETTPIHREFPVTFHRGEFFRLMAQGSALILTNPIFAGGTTAGTHARRW